MTNDEREKWLAERRKGLGASDAAAVMGLNPFRTPLDVWIDKVRPDLIKESVNQDLLDFGNDVEPAIERAYERQTRVALAHHDPVQHPEFPEIRCTPDRITLDRRKLVQLKWETRFSDKFGRPGTDEVPDAYLIQCAHEMVCVGCEFEDIATMHAGPPLLIFPLHRDRELEKRIIDYERGWWNDYVVKQVEPPITGDASWSKYLAQKYPTHGMGMLTPAPEQMATLGLDSLKNQLKVVADLEQSIEATKNVIKAFIGEYDGLLCPDGTKIYWKRDQDTVKDVTDWERCFMDYAEIFHMTPEYRDKHIAKHTQKNVVVRHGARKFVIREPKEKK